MNNYISSPIKGENQQIGFDLSHEHKTHNTNIEQKVVSVDGVIFDTTLNLELPFVKYFGNSDDANQYYESVIEKYPNSQVAVIEKTETEIKVWA